MKKNTVSAALVANVLVAIALSGCEAKNAEAPREQVSLPQEVKSFSKETLVLEDVKLFFWKEEMSPEQVENVLKISKDQDKGIVDEAATKAKTAELTELFKSKQIDLEVFAEKQKVLANALQATDEVLAGLLKKKPGLEATLEKWKNDETAKKDAAKGKADMDAAEQALKSADTELESATTEQSSQTAQKDQVEAELTAEKIKEEAVQDKKKIESLQATLEKLVAQVKELEKKVADATAKKTAKKNDLKTKADKYSKLKLPAAEKLLADNVSKTAEKTKQREEQLAEIASLTNSLKDAGLDQAYVDLNVSKIALGGIQERNRAYTSDIKRYVELYENVDSDRAITFTLDFTASGELAVRIDNWDLSLVNDPLVQGPVGPQSFSTADGSIKNAIYTERGGVYAFDVVADEATYQFKVWRSKYGSADGRIYVQGDMTRVLSEEACAKLHEAKPEAKCNRTGSAKMANGS